MTSCLVSRSISSIRATSKVAPLALAQMVLAASFGMVPNSASASAACASISNQILKRVWGSQIAAIPGRVYRGIIGGSEPFEGVTGALAERARGDKPLPEGVSPSLWTASATLISQNIE